MPSLQNNSLREDDSKNRSQIVVALTPEKKKIIREAGRSIGLVPSAYLREAGLLRARELAKSKEILLQEVKYK